MKRKSTASSKEKARARRLWTLFRLKPEEHSRILEFQKNHPIYKQLLGQRLGTDHCHKSGLIRGLLEWRINRAYGLLEKVCPNNIPGMLRALALFHEQPPAEIALGKQVFGLVGQAKHKRKMIYGSPDLLKKGK